MKDTLLEFEGLEENKHLVQASVLNFIENNFTKEEQKEIKVAEIDTAYIDGISLCEHYKVDRKNGCNCLIVELKRASTKQYAALLVPVGYKYNMSTTVRKYTNSRMVSVAPLDYVLEHTKMEHGSINPIGIPQTWKIFIDKRLLDVDEIVCGSGKRISKLRLPSKYLLKLPNVIVLENLGKTD